MGKSVDEKFQDNFSLLCEIIREPAKNQKLKADLSRIEAIIQNEIPDALKKNAPEDFYILYTDFKAEYDRFRDFILYDKLIGKNVVALGGGFSSGKSSFLNALMGGRKILPEDLDPSTAVPTYIVRGKEHEAHGLNVFDAQVTLNIRRGDLRNIAHGFGEVTDEDDDDHKITDSVTLGHVLKSVFFSTPLHGYEHIAFLDTPGYSKPDAAEYSIKTDEQIARGQLNTSNFILWFVPLEKNGTISQTDIDFIRTLREDIPKMVILSQSDKKDISNLHKIIERTKADLNLKGIRYVDVRAFSSRREQVTEPELSRFLDSERAAILMQLDAWNAAKYHTNFAWNFKKLFVRCKSYYEETINEESRKLNRVNYSLTVLSGPDEAMEPLRRMAAVYQTEIASLKDILKTVKRLQDDFFTEIKRVSDEVGIQMPEPAEIDLMNADARTLQHTVEDIQRNASPETLNLLKDAGNVTKKLPEVISENYSSIKNPPLQKETDYLRDGYFKTLALIPLAQDKGITREQRTLLSGLLTGIGENFRPEILARAQKMEMKEYDEYMDNLKVQPFRYRFALDAILLACCDDRPNEGALKVAAAMLQTLGVDRTTGEYLCALAKSVLAQDSDALWRTRSMEKRADCDESLFDGYIIQFIKDWVHISDTLIEIRFLERKSIETLPFNVWQSLKNLTISDIANDYWNALLERELGHKFGRKTNSDSKAPRTAFFENVFFPGNGWKFSNYDKITFKNCVFHLEKPSPSTNFQREQFKNWDTWSKCLSVTNVKQLQFEQCCFYNCNGVAVAEQDVQSASFEKCRFENCWLLHRQGQHYRALGALIHDYGNNGTNTISHSEFVNCGGVGFDFLVLVSAYLSNCKCIVRENRFEHCKHYHSYGHTNSMKERDNRYDNHTRLFLPGTADEGNTLINSARIS